MHLSHPEAISTPTPSPWHQKCRRHYSSRFKQLISTVRGLYWRKKLQHGEYSTLLGILISRICVFGILHTFHVKIEYVYFPGYFCLFCFIINWIRWSLNSLYHRTFTNSREFPGCPVVRCLYFCCRRHGFDPWSGNYDPIYPMVGPKKKSVHK